MAFAPEHPLFDEIGIFKGGARKNLQVVAKHGDDASRWVDFEPVGMKIIGRVYFRFGSPNILAAEQKNAVGLQKKYVLEMSGADRKAKRRR